MHVLYHLLPHDGGTTAEQHSTARFCENFLMPGMPSRRFGCQLYHSKQNTFTRVFNRLGAVLVLSTEGHTDIPQ